nr:tetratricopeptide repeat protein [Marinibactrum halimedae]
MYQLSKAYALDGRTEESDATLEQLAREYPTSPFLAESDFRRAERDFARQDYRSASAGYASVVMAGPESAFYENALYMLGWSLFKRGIYEDAIDSFTGLLDIYLTDGSELEDLTGTPRNLTEDTLRVISLCFSYLDGPLTIASTYDRLGARDYEHMLYSNLAGLYLEKQRFNDSADAYEMFIQRYPLSDKAPQFSAAKIDVYEKGGFPDLQIAERANFVRRYGVNSEYWALKDDEAREVLKKTLHPFIIDLAKYRHTRAQRWEVQLAKQPAGVPLKLDSDIIDGPAVINEFALAARWYREFVETFPADKNTGEMTYLLAESLYSAGQVEAAYAEYRNVAYKHKDERYGSEAAYSAVVLARELRDSSNAPEQQTYWNTQLIDSGLRFAEFYKGDQRAVVVLADSAQLLLNANQPQRAIDAALEVTLWQPAPEKEVLKTAWLVAAQAQFDTDQYGQAEFAYSQVLALLPKNDPQREAIRQRLAASVYQQAEMLLATGDRQGAVDQLLRVRSMLPNSDIATTAHFDAANYLMEMEDWGRAEQELLSFRQQHPNHELTSSIGAKLVVVYQAQQSWSAAAKELKRVIANDSDPEAKRQSQLLMAEFYEKAGDMENAIDSYRSYAHGYPEPFDENIEAQQKMTELYAQTQQVDKRNFWLRKIIATHDAAGAQASDRSLYLAATSAGDLAEQQYQVFESIPLRLPLKTSLKKKKSALEKTLKAYEKALDYDIQDVSTKATHRIGEVYAQLSRDLMDSERPKGLSDLELEQYEILLEEQAYPFEDQAIEILAKNSERSWQGVYDEWVKESFDSLARLLPGRYNKPESSLEFSNEVY